jgi:hypothetical protein
MEKKKALVRMLIWRREKGSGLSYKTIDSGHVNAAHDILRRRFACCHC